MTKNWQAVKKQLINIFLLPVPIIFIISFFAFPFVFYCLSNPDRNEFLNLASYFLSAYAFVLLCVRSPYIYKRSKELIKGDELHLVVLIKRWMCQFKYSEMYLKDVEFRASIALFFGFCIDAIYALLRCYAGTINQSFWFIAIGLYYLVFAVIRFMLIQRWRKSKQIKDKMKEGIFSLRTYRLCGLLIFLLNVTMAGMIIQMVEKNEVIQNYNINEIYLVALYTFYRVIVSVYNMLKFRKDRHLILSAGKNLSFVAALMSLFTLQTVMLLTFNDPETPRQAMNALTGALVIVFSLLVAIFMIQKANWKLKNLEKEQFNNSLTFDKQDINK